MPKFSLVQILSVCASGAFSTPIDEAELEGIRRLDPSDERDLVSVLAEHRLQLLFWEALKQEGQEGLVSKEAREQFDSMRRDSLIRAAAFEMALMSASEAIAEHQTVIACKGAVLAQHYYPRRGLRRMHDVDFWLVEPNMDACRAALQKVGFTERPEKANADARNFIGPSRTVLDVHTHMGLFQDRGHQLMELSRPLDGANYRVFVPEAMVVHLVTHLLGHATETGIFICWLLDIALVLRKHSVDPVKIKSLCRDDGSWMVFLRFLRAFNQLGWVKESWGLEAEMSAARPFSWDVIARQRRRSAWTGLRGKIRLGRTLLLRPEEYPPLPHVSDFLWQPLDWLAEANSVTGGQGALFTPRREEG